MCHFEAWKLCAKKCKNLQKFVLATNSVNQYIEPHLVFGYILHLGWRSWYLVYDCMLDIKMVFLIFSMSKNCFRIFGKKFSQSSHPISALFLAKKQKRDRIWNVHWGVDALLSCIGRGNAINLIPFGLKFIALVVTRESTGSEWRWDSYTVFLYTILYSVYYSVHYTILYTEWWDSYTGRGQPMSPVQPVCDIRNSHADVWM